MQDPADIPEHMKSELDIQSSNPTEQLLFWLEKKSEMQSKVHTVMPAIRIQILQ